MASLPIQENNSLKSFVGLFGRVKAFTRNQGVQRLATETARLVQDLADFQELVWARKQNGSHVPASLDHDFKSMHASLSGRAIPIASILDRKDKHSFFLKRIWRHRVTVIELQRALALSRGAVEVMVHWFQLKWTIQTRLMISDGAELDWRHKPEERARFLSLSKAVSDLKLNIESMRMQRDQDFALHAINNFKEAEELKAASEQSLQEATLSFSARSYLTYRVHRLEELMESLTMAEESMDALSADAPRASLLCPPGSSQDLLDRAVSECGMVESLLNQPSPPSLCQCLSRVSDTVQALDNAALFPEALSLASKCVMYGRKCHKEGDAVSTQRLARYLQNLSIAQARLGLYEEALCHQQENSRLCRQLDKKDHVRAGPVLARALEGLSYCYDSVGKSSDSLEPARQAVDLWRQLFGTDVLYKADLARSLHRLSCCLYSLGQDKECVQPIEESLALYHQLYDQAPATHRASYATALAQSAFACISTEDTLKATVHASQALELARTEFSSRPAFQLYLAYVLHVNAVSLYEAALFCAATETSAEAVSLARSVFRRRPKATVLVLAQSLIGLSKHRLAVGRFEEASLSAQEALVLYTTLPEAKQTDKLLVASRALAHLCQGIALGETGDTTAAIASLRKAISLYTVHGRRPQSASIELAKAHCACSRLLLQDGSASDAIEEAEVSVQLCHDSLSKLPKAARQQMAISLEQRALCLGPPDAPKTILRSRNV